MPPPYDTPEQAIAGLIEAYRDSDVEEIVRNKDFDLDSRLFWQDLGLPVSPEQLIESRQAFETNFRSKLKEEGIPDYASVAFRTVSEQHVQDNIVIVTVACAKSDGSGFQLKLPTVKTVGGWKVVLHPRYDHL